MLGHGPTCGDAPIEQALGPPPTDAVGRVQLNYRSHRTASSAPRPLAPKERRQRHPAGYPASLTTQEVRTLRGSSQPLDRMPFHPDVPRRTWTQGLSDDGATIAVVHTRRDVMGARRHKPDQVVSPMSCRWDSSDVTDRVAVPAAILAALLGLASAGVSAYWAVGGTGLLDTIGGSIERWGRERATAVGVVLWFIVALKIIVALAAPILIGIGSDRLPAWTTARVPRALGWIAAATLTVYGGIYTIAGLLVQTGAVEATADTDPKALAWHAYLWDPWFAVWGLAFVVALWLSRRDAIQQR